MGSGIADIRQQNLRKLRVSYSTNAALAEVIGVAPDYVSRLLSSGPNRKRLKEDLARKIEKRAGLSPFWLDTDENASQVVAAPLWPFSFSRANYERLDPRDRDKIDQAIKIMMSLCEGNRLERAVKKRAA